MNLNIFILFYFIFSPLTLSKRVRGMHFLFHFFSFTLFSLFFFPSVTTKHTVSLSLFLISILGFKIGIWFGLITVYLCLWSFLPRSEANQVAAWWQCWSLCTWALTIMKACKGAMKEEAAHSFLFSRIRWKCFTLLLWVLSPSNLMNSIII